MIEIRTQRIAAGGNIRLPPPAKISASGADVGMHVLLCERHVDVSVPAGMVGIWCPLKNGAWIEVPSARFFVRRGEIFTSDAEHSHEVSCPMSGACIGLIAAHEVWAGLMSSAGGVRSELPAVFPARHRATPTMRLALLRLARAALDVSGTLAKPGADDFSRLLIDLQQPFAPMLEQCPGPSLARKRRIFLRLQRARHLIQINSSSDIDIPMLATLTSYSPNQFIRLFQKVFGETPYASLLRTRVEFAGRLIAQSSMNIREVLHLSGFENRTTFARAFKVRFGSTATSYRSISRRAS